MDKLTISYWTLWKRCAAEANLRKKGHLRKFRRLKCTDLTFVKKKYATAFFEAKKLRKNAHFPTFANSQQKYVNGLKWD